MQDQGQKVSQKPWADQISEAQIQTWKREHGRVYVYHTPDGKWCILRKPTLMILDACKSLSGSSNIRFSQALVENCWLSGSPEFKTDDEYQLGLFDWLGVIIKQIDGELEEL